MAWHGIAWESGLCVYPPYINLRGPGAWWGSPAGGPFNFAIYICGLVAKNVRMGSPTTVSEQISLLGPHFGYIYIYVVWVPPASSGPLGDRLGVRGGRGRAPDPLLRPPGTSIEAECLPFAGMPTGRSHVPSGRSQVPSGRSHVSSSICIYTYIYV